MAKSVNLFDTAAKTTPTKAKTKDKEEINISTLTNDKGEIRFPNSGQLLVDYQKYHAQKAEAEAMLKTKGEQIKEIGLELWIEQYEQGGNRPESFILTGTTKQKIEGREVDVNGRLMFISSDSYKKIDEIAATVLESKYGCIERNEVFSFNNELLTKYREAISNALMNCKEIPDADKAKLIVKTENVTIKKGTIENINLVASITGKPEKKKKAKEGEEPALDKFENIRELVTKVEPTFSLKNI